MKNLVAIINENTDTMKFADHFKFKNSIKNLLRDFPKPKVLTKAFEEESFTKALMDYEDISGKFVDIVSNAMILYTAQYKEWRENESVPGLPHRVSFFMGAVDDVMCKDKKIADTLADFSKTEPGKEIEAIVKGAVGESDKSDDVLMDLLVAMAVRETINNATSVNEEPKPEEKKPETSSKKPTNSNPIADMLNMIGDKFDSMNKKDLAEKYKDVLLKLVDPNVSADETAELLGNMMKEITSEIVKDVKKSETDSSVESMWEAWLNDDPEVLSGDVVGADGKTIVSDSHKEFEKSNPKTTTEKEPEDKHEIQDGFKSEKGIFTEVMEMLKSLNFNSPDTSIDSALKTLYPFLINGMDELIAGVNGFTSQSTLSQYDDVMRLLPVKHIETINGFEVDKLVKLIVTMVYKPVSGDDENETGCVDAVSAYLAVSAIDMIKNPNDMDKFYKFGRLFVRVIGTPNYMKGAYRKKLCKYMEDIEFLVNGISDSLRKPCRSADAASRFMEEAGNVVIRAYYKGIYRMVRKEAAA